jgi:hypothetical protein
MLQGMATSILDGGRGGFRNASIIAEDVLIEDNFCSECCFREPHASCTVLLRLFSHSPNPSLPRVPPSALRGVNTIMWCDVHNTME